MKLTFVLNALLIRDFYTNLMIPSQYKSREHVVPKSLLLPVHRSDKDNIVSIDVTLNNFRSNYRFSELSRRDINEFPRHIPILHDVNRLSDSVLIPFYATDFQRQVKVLVACKNTKDRLFYPLLSHNKIIKIIDHMLKKYPYLRIDDLVEDPLIFKRWMKK